MNSYKLYAVNYADPAYEFRRKVNTDSLKNLEKWMKCLNMVQQASPNSLKLILICLNTNSEQACILGSLISF